MPTVLLVEDEAVLRSTLKRSLSKLPGIEVVDTGLLSQAKVLARAECPDLLVSDLSLPDGTALELLAEMDHLGMHIPVIFMTAYLGAFVDRIPQRRNLEVHEKPVPLGLLKRRVLACLEPATAPGVSPFSVAEYLQLAGMGRHSVVVRLFRAGQLYGWVEMVDGQLWSATALEDTGLKAIYRLAFATGFEITVTPLVGPPGERNLHTDLNHALLEAARIQDEAQRLGQPPPTLESTVVPPQHSRPGTRTVPPPLPAGVVEEETPVNSIGGWLDPAPTLEPELLIAIPTEGPELHQTPVESSSAVESYQQPSQAETAPDETAPLQFGSGNPRSTMNFPTLPSRFRFKSASPAAQPPEEKLESSDALADRDFTPAQDPAAAALAWVDEPVSRVPAERVPEEVVVEQPPEAPGRADAVRFATCMEDGIDALLARDYHMAYVAFSEAIELDPGSAVAQANLNRIRQMGKAPD